HRGAGRHPAHHPDPHQSPRRPGGGPLPAERERTHHDPGAGVVQRLGRTRIEVPVLLVRAGTSHVFQFLESVFDQRRVGLNPSIMPAWPRGLPSITSASDSSTLTTSLLGVTSTSGTP